MCTKSVSINGQLLSIKDSNSKIIKKQKDLKFNALTASKV